MGKVAGKMRARHRLENCDARTQICINVNDKSVLLVRARCNLHNIRIVERTKELGQVVSYKPLKRSKTFL